MIYYIINILNNKRFNFYSFLNNFKQYILLKINLLVLNYIFNIFYKKKKKMYLDILFFAVSILIAIGSYYFFFGKKKANN